MAPKQRKRRRQESTTPRKGKKKGSTSSTRTPGSGESKIVWKDSPADKQIKVSGTGKMAVRREMQGFVGRLARASQQSPPSSSDEDKRTGRERGRTRRKAEEKATSRHLMFSPPGQTIDNGGRRKSTERGDSQDELFSVLDQMEQKYASPDVTGLTASRSTSPRRRQQSLPSSAEETKLTPTPVPSYDSTGTLSPRSLQTQEASRTQDVARPRNPEVLKALAAIHEQEEFKTPEKPIVVEADPFDDLTDESWALLDQLQSQRAPMQQTQSQTELVSSQSFALTPRPMPSTAYAEQKPPPSGAVASAMRPMHGVGAAPQPATPESYTRFLVLEVDRDVVNRSLLLRLLDDQDVQLEALLIDDWYDVLIEAGDTINIVFTEQDRDGFFSQDASSGAVARQASRIQVDNAHNVVVVHPDILVSPTRVTTSFGCLRRAVLQETLAVSRPTGKKAFLGTLKHDLFEYAVLNGLDDARALLEQAKRIVNSNILGLVESGLNEEEALLELQKVIGDYRSWVSSALAGSGTSLNELPPKTGSKARVSRVLATEEMMWSIKWGLKGATDASVEGSIVDPGSINGPNTGSTVLPLELKTGSKKYAGVEHQGQVILYTLLLNERYRQKCQDGLLIYVPPIETNRIPAMATHVRGLLMARNNFASAIAKVKAIGGSTSAQVFPPMIRNRRDCERCFQVEECVLHHAATENGTAESSGLDELFTNMTKHLGGADLTYFRTWNRLIDLEQQHAEKNLRALWLQVGWKRELAQESSTCIAQLKLVADAPAQSESGAKRTLRFVRDRRKRRDVDLATGGAPQPTSFAGVRFRVDERVILSAESLDGKNLLVHVSRATVRKIEHGLITIESRQSIPSIVTSGLSAVGKEFTWRLDKDAIMSGLRRAKENLVRLFIGTPPEGVSAGTALSRRPELQVRMDSTASLGSGDGDDKAPGVGDTRRRNLIVHLSRPHFKPCRVTELIKQRCQDCVKEDHDGAMRALGQSLLDAFCGLNIDQQRAVHRVLSSLDYALVLGMPGTGKTATIAYTVRVLLFLGFSVLVTSYTHSAVDNLLLKLLACKVPMLRIGNTAQVHPSIAEYTLDRQAAREGISSVQAMEAKMMNAPLVGCTCLSVNSHVLFSKRRFDFCIVDEATQITQPIVLSALRCADTFVLVGDHYQLPPLVANAQARKEGMDVSLFRRLAEAHPEATQQLSYQYRMNRDVMLLANRLVYGDKLKCGSFQVASNLLNLRWHRQETIGHKLAWPIRVLTGSQGVVFLDTDSMGNAATESSGNGQVGSTGRRRMENVVEAQVIAGLVELLVLASVPAEEIAVISPFRSQVALIQQHLATVAALRRAGGSEWVHSIEVSTIDKYQGKDKGVILVSFVRCNDEKHVGELLTDWRRINVALTRAKQKLLLVGSEATLSGGSALFHVLAGVIQEQRWGYKLPRDAVETLRQLAVSVAAPVEPDPEQGTTPARPQSVKVSILQRSAGSNDIESLVPNVSSVPLRQLGARPPQMKPISRDIFGEM